MGRGAMSGAQERMSVDSAVLLPKWSFRGTSAYKSVCAHASRAASAYKSVCAHCDDPYVKCRFR